MNTTKYHFTNKLAKNICRICLEIIAESYSSGGVGAVCEHCSSIRDKIDLIDERIIRNIALDNKSFKFEAKIDNVWYKCSSPCGNWSSVDGWLEHGIFSVPVGFWELKELYENHCI